MRKLPLIYLRLILLACLSCLFFLSACLVINRQVDPYSLSYQSTKASNTTGGCYGAKYSVFKKARDIKDIRPKTIFTGTSRVLIALNPSSSQAYPEPVYNAAIAGTSIREQRLMLEFAYKNSPIQMVVAGLNFSSFSFNAMLPGRGDLEDIELLSAHANRRTLADQLKVWGRYLSLEMLLTSASALFSEFPFNCQIQDMRDGQVISQEVVLGVPGQEPRINHFRAVEKNQFSRFLGRETVDSSNYFASEKTGSTLGEYEQLLRFCYSNQIKLTMFISPIHARLLEKFFLYGFEQAYYEWQRHLVTINESVAQEFDTVPFALWDFSGFTPWTTEPVPEGPGPSSMRWYIEGSHYTEALGDMVLRKISSVNSTPKEFGNLLTGNNIERLISTMKMDRIKWESSNPEIRNELSH